MIVFFWLSVGILSLSFLQVSTESKDKLKFARTLYVPETNTDLHLKFARIAT